jgi:hypothetical protein
MILMQQIKNGQQSEVNYVQTSTRAVLPSKLTSEMKSISLQHEYLSGRSKP